MFRTSKCSSSKRIVHAVLWYFFHAEENLTEGVDNLTEEADNLTEGTDNLTKEWTIYRKEWTI